jgi:hypothetical protein
LQHAVHALVLLREAEIFEDVERDRTVRPDLRGVVFPLRGEIGFGENFKRRAARLFVGQCGDFLFQFGKAGQASEQMSLDEEGRFWMASRGHAEIVSIYSAKKSLRANRGHLIRPAATFFPSDAEKELFVGQFPGIVALRQRRANFRSAFSAKSVSIRVYPWFNGFTDSPRLRHKK